MDQERGATPGLGPQAILDDREDDLRRGIVVRLEQMTIAGVQRERARDHLLRRRQGLGVLRRAGVDLRVQVELGQQHRRGFLGGAAIGSAARRRRQVGLHGGQLAHQEIEDRLAGALQWRGEPDRIGLRHQRDVAEQIDPVPVAERPEEPGLGPERLDGRREARARRSAPPAWHRRSGAGIRSPWLTWKATR